MAKLSQVPPVVLWSVRSEGAEFLPWRFSSFLCSPSARLLLLPEHGRDL